MSRLWKDGEELLCLRAENARLREILEETRGAEMAMENLRLREELEDYKQAAGAEAEIADEFKAQRDTLLAALKEIEAGPYNGFEQCRGIARAAIAEVGGEK